MASTTAGRPRGGGPDGGERETAVEPYRLTPKLARRNALLGALLLVGFAALVMRLWTLQVLAGSEYAAKANANRTRTVPVFAERGAIVDRHGDPLVTSAAVTAVELYASGLPPVGAKRHSELLRLAAVTHVPYLMILREVGQREAANDILNPIPIRTEAAKPLVAYLKERESEFPGVSLAQSYVRHYPHGDLAAQLFGVVRQVTQAQLDANPQRYQSGDEIGQSGIEARFNTDLQGIDGAMRVHVDAFERIKSQRTLGSAPVQGHTVKLTIDTGLQVAAQNALAYGIERARSNGEVWADGGAIVAMDPQTGAILAAASSPTYNPALYTGTVSPSKLAAAGLTDTTALAHNYPLYNRAFDGRYPPGSTFKPLTAIAALQEGLVGPYAPLLCSGTYVAPEDLSHRVWHNWDTNINQWMPLTTALAYSCDTYFYRLGNDFYSLPADRGQPEQAWATKFGFGQQTPVVGQQDPGLLPTIDWKHHTFTPKTDKCCWQVDRLWKPGDSIQLAIGQGDLLVTPLQMARFYSAIANGGKLVRPHILLDVEDPNGGLLRAVPPPVPKPIPGLNQSYLHVVQAGLFEATHLSFGTSYGVFGNFPIPIAGKTGTAQKVVQLPNGFAPLLNQSWWCGYGPYTGAKLVVCAVIENGGHGGDAAAPAAERVFEKFFHVRQTSLGYIHSD